MQNWENKIKLCLKKRDLAEIDLDLINTAFTHPSYKGLDPLAEDYERLEFLGDAVLDLVTADYLIKNNPGEEGQLTEKRKQLVSNHTLSGIFDEFDLAPLIRTNKFCECVFRSNFS